MHTCYSMLTLRVGNAATRTPLSIETDNDDNTRATNAWYMTDTVNCDISKL